MDLQTRPTVGTFFYAPAKKGGEEEVSKKILSIRKVWKKSEEREREKDFKISISLLKVIRSRID